MSNNFDFTKRSDRWLFGILCLVAITMVILIITTEVSGDLKAGTASNAKIMAQAYIKQDLKAPSTAEFTQISAESIGDDEFKVVYDVDAQNTYGAMIRNRFACRVRYHSKNGKWELISLRRK